MHEALLHELVAGDWSFQGWAEDVHLSDGVSADVVTFLASVVRPGDRTLETGAGCSTVVFTLAGAHHTAISPFPVEHERVRRWCEERQVPLDNLTLINGLSQFVLPGLNDELDLVLIDGDHAFPTPFIDFYYACRKLRPGGLVVVDDVHIRTGYLLAEFLSTEKKRWRMERQFPRTVVFAKVGAGDVIEPEGWLSQPFCSVARLVPGVTPASLSERIRFHLRLRSRVRNLLARRIGSWPIGDDL